MQILSTSRYAPIALPDKPGTPAPPVGKALVTMRDADEYRRGNSINGLIEMSATLIAQQLDPSAIGARRSIGLLQAVSAYETASDLTINGPDVRSILL